MPNFISPVMHATDPVAFPCVTPSIGTRSLSTRGLSCDRPCRTDATSRRRVVTHRETALIGGAVRLMGSESQLNVRNTVPLPTSGSRERYQLLLEMAKVANSHLDFNDVLAWYVLNTPVEISPAQIEAFAKLYPHDVRPVQSVNGRMIQVSQ